MTMAAGSLAAIVVHGVARLAYVVGVGAMLRRQEKDRVFTRDAGVEAGFAKFRRVASWLMYVDGATFALLCVVTRGTVPVGPRPGVLLGTGALLFVVGVGTKWWAASRLAPGAYYWRNFFDDAPQAPLPRPGPYRFFRNPMYTLGNLHLYGLALILASAPALILSAFDQAALMVFNVVVEKPHFIRISGSS